MYRRVAPFARPIARADGRRSVLTALFAALLAAMSPIGVPRTLSAQDASRGSIAGTVVDSATGTRIAGATVAIVGTARGALTGDDGQFTLADLAAGTYQLRARALSRRP